MPPTVVVILSKHVCNWFEAIAPNRCTKREVWPLDEQHSSIVHSELPHSCYPHTVRVFCEVKSICHFSTVICAASTGGWRRCCAHRPGLCFCRDAPQCTDTLSPVWAGAGLLLRLCCLDPGLFLFATRRLINSVGYRVNIWITQSECTETSRGMHSSGQSLHIHESNQMRNREKWFPFPRFK